MRKAGKQSKIMALITIVVLMLGVIPQAAVGSMPPDISGHWAQSQITDWLNQGLAGGYPDSTFKPDNSITRAEFMVLVNKAFGFTETAQARYKDVKTSDWFATDLARAKEAGYVSGYPDGTIRPNNSISRQEAASMLARLLKLNTADTSSVSKFKDAAQIPRWSKGAISAAAAAGYMQGYPDMTFRPEKKVTRAEAIVFLSRSLAGGNSPAVPQKTVTYNQAGTYGPASGQETINGDVCITASGVVLKNVLISGNLVLDKGIGEGSVTLNNITVKGTTTILGGGANSVTFENCATADITLNKEGARLVAKGKSGLGKVTMKTGGRLVEDSLEGNGFTSVTIAGESAKTVLAGEFDSVQLDAAKVSLEITSGVVNDLTITAHGKDAKVTGKGQINTANVNATGVVIEQKPGKINIGNNITAIIAGKTEKGDTAAGGGGGSSSSGSSLPAGYSVNGNTATVANLEGILYALNQSGITVINGKGSNITGNVIINKPGLTLQNMTITGDLEAGSGIGAGDLTLESVNVTGKTTFNGGGSNSVHLTGTTQLQGTVEINREGLRLVADSGSVLVTGNIRMNMPATLEAAANVFTGTVTINIPTTYTGSSDVVIAAPLSGSINIQQTTAAVGIQVTESGSASINITAANARIEIAPGVTVTGTISIAATAAGVEIENSGTINQLNAQVTTTITGNAPDNISGTAPTLKAAKPAATPSGGAVSLGTQIVLSSATVGSAVYYTIDGSVPGATVSDSVYKYTGAITIAKAMTIKAIATKADMLNSDVMTESYTIGGGGGSTPTNNPPVAKPVADRSVIMGGNNLILTGADLATDPDGDALTVTGATYGTAGIVSLDWLNGSLVISPLAAGTTTVTASVYDSANQGVDVSFSVTVNEGAAISNFACVDHDDTSATFTWTAPTGASQVIIFQTKTDPDTVPSGQSITWKGTEVAPDAGTGTVVNLDPGIKYWFYLHVIGGTNAGDSNIVSLSTSVLGPSQIVVHNNAGLPDYVEVYDLLEGDTVNVYDSADGGSPLGSQTVGQDETDVNISIDQLGSVAGSVFVTVTRPPDNESNRVEKTYDAEFSPPSNVSALPSHNDAGEAVNIITWNDSESQNVTSYYIIRYDVNTDAAEYIGSVIDKNTQTYTDTTAVPGTAYIYCVVAGDGNKTFALSEPSAQITTLQNTAPSESVTLEYLGHSAFVLTTPGGQRVLLDPEHSYGNALDPVDLAIISHEHSDHNQVAAAAPGLGEDKVIHGINGGSFNSVTDAVYGDLTVSNVQTSHFDNAQNNASFILSTAGMRLVHMGDSLGTCDMSVLNEFGLGTNGPPADEMAQNLKGPSGIDVLMIPIGDSMGMNGLDTSVVIKAIEKLAPKIVIPIHSWNETNISNFLAAVGDTHPEWSIVNPRDSQVTFTAGDLSAGTVIWNMQPSSSINGLWPTSSAGVAGSDTALDVNVDTTSIADGTGVSVELVDTAGNSLSPQVTGASTISNNSAIVSLAIPGTVPAGYYRLKAVAGDSSNTGAVFTVNSASINYVSPWPTGSEVGTEATTDVAITTAGIADGTPVTVELVTTCGDSLGQPVISTSTISNNEATVSLTIPAWVPFGSYKLKIMAGDDFHGSTDYYIY
ncbi:S-layer homology domain-containing protein [Desulfotruncus alcoholivorax]|uniref:S-layer homology domain-containing protein n=1 Tax=Desulfotruncus alcoholivorax TaxID=265477 RepID=UPI000417B2DF|nr:S-layer homology domain-containing protein [Desulfotruncus alcoholivorax]